MEKGSSKGSGPSRRNIEEIMRERMRLDQILEEDFRKKMTVLFSDICGYTAYMDKAGDIEGRAWAQRHHDIVLPLIEAQEGKVLAVMGDGVMAAFTATVSAVKAATEIQRALHDYNSRVGEPDSIHVRIGINSGYILVDGDDIAGDAVNVASRIESQADPDQILISKSVYEDVCGSEDILCRSHGTAQIKGKQQRLELYRVIWQDEEIVLSPDPKLRTHEVSPREETREPLTVFQLEITRDKEQLAISAYEQRAGEGATVRHYEKVSVPMDRIASRCRELSETLNQVNRNGRITRQVLRQLQEVGQGLRDDIFTHRVKQKLQETKSDHLILNLDDKLVQIPWELLHDGKRFLCQQFNVGRLVKTRQAVLAGKTRMLARPLKMLILADPGGDLKGAYEEGTRVRNRIDKDKDFIAVSLLSDNITTEFIKEKIRNYDLVHFAGHADYNLESPEESGWRLSSGTIKAKEIIKMGGTAAMPALIFSNACQSARTEEWAIHENFQGKIFGLANAFILAGVKHYVGTFWEVLDEPSRDFALEFYGKLFSGITIGKAVQSARNALIEKYGEETIVWASYVLYGDPTSNYLDQIRRTDRETGAGAKPARSRDEEVRSKQAGIDLSQVKTPIRKSAWWAAALGIILLLGTLLWGYPGILRDRTGEYRDRARAYYQQGQFEEALKSCDALEKRRGGAGVAYLIRGNIHLRRGNLDEAESAYHKAHEASRKSQRDMAEALMGLGRIASLRNQPEKAIAYYREATEKSPGEASGYLSQALVLEHMGDYAGALNSLGKARGFSPDNQALKALANETRDKLTFIRDREVQQRTDRLIKEMLERPKSVNGLISDDGWTSRPLTLFLLDFRRQGYSLQEGEERLLQSGITDRLIRSGRIRVVERALIDKLLEELRLSTTQLVDANTALSLGKMLAARLMGIGNLVYSGPNTQISFRIIETETGEIVVAVNESFGNAVPASVLSQKVADGLLKDLTKRYPLRGKISYVEDGKIQLNIGYDVGVRTGLRFRVLDRGVQLLVTAAEANACTCDILEGTTELQEGLRVEAASDV